MADVWKGVSLIQRGSAFTSLHAIIMAIAGVPNTTGRSSTLASAGVIRPGHLLRRHVRLARPSLVPKLRGLVYVKLAVFIVSAVAITGQEPSPKAGPRPLLKPA
ncbi:hypothetical protein MAPG_07564 [Magnaporthiopsis poae ATCC 64411]|uniref:Uncharacterized protein n=1 Tax=Magnaporthiopsis poae (strain ATCC 64411 / 73-15) TaxID=644358 RepID=A0A0C4E505_MAGP6|nr:hypothetical protein MAPG_07564 [Magnaporthiopsis poae ATCC 64411]